jgi:quinoprotein dehydrogenase-associated probable ABC transporter substrate-binding protein
MRHETLAIALVFLAGANAAEPLRVCASSDNFPFSARDGSGFENKLADLIAAKLGTTVATTWWPARQNFLDRTLNKGLCDVVMGVPAGLDDVATTRPYYRSSYVLISRADEPAVTSLTDARLKALKIGVYLIGDEQTPPALALSREGLSENLRGYMTFFDRGPAEAGLITAVEKHNIDVAAAWGPLVGFYARQPTLRVTPIRDTGFQPLVFQFDIAMGVRPGDMALRDRLDAAIAANRDGIDRILTSYGVPLIEGDKP